MSQKVWFYGRVGSQLMAARIDADGCCYTAAGSLMEDLPTEFHTRASVNSVLAVTGARVDSLATIALVGPNGGSTEVARALRDATGRAASLSRAYTLEEIVTKCVGADAAPALLALIAAEYETEVEAAA